MRPLVVRHEIDGFIADRLLEALWREALWLVADDVATVEEVDDAIRFGAGLRWAAMGTFLTYRLAGGEAGMRHFMAQFGPALQLPWTRLTDVPAGRRAARQAGGPVRRAGGRALDRRARAVARRLPGGGARRAARPGLRRRRDGGADRAPVAGDRPRTGRSGPAQSPLRLHTALVTPGLDRLQRPHDRVPLPAGAGRHHRRVPRPQSASTPPRPPPGARTTRSSHICATSARHTPATGCTSPPGCSATTPSAFTCSTSCTAPTTRRWWPPASTCWCTVDTSAGRAVPLPARACLAALAQIAHVQRAIRRCPRPPARGSSDARRGPPGGGGSL